MKYPFASRYRDTKGCLGQRTTTLAGRMPQPRSAATISGGPKSHHRRLVFTLALLFPGARTPSIR